MFDWRSKSYKGYKPVRENSHLCKIVEVRWPEDDLENYSVISISVFRKVMSVGANVAGTNWPNSAPVDEWALGLGNSPDQIALSMFSHKSHNWPWTTVTGSGGTAMVWLPPIDEDPNQIVHDRIIDADAAKIVVKGVPPCPLVSTIGSGAPCRLFTGFPFSNQEQDPGYSTGVRSKPGSGSFSPRYPKDVPKPPEYFGVKSAWGGPVAKIEFYTMHDIPSSTSGPTIGTFNLDFGSMMISSPPRKRQEDDEEVPVGEEEEVGAGFDEPQSNIVFRAVATAPVPKEDTFAQHEPPFTGVPVRQNRNGLCNVWVLMERDPDTEPFGEE